MGQRQSSVENMVISSDFWKGKTVFVTGHTGFKGSWLILWLQKLGADVVGYSLSPTTRPSLYELASASGGIRSVMGDVRDLPLLVETMTACRPNIVIHMAAQSLVLPSYADPITTYSTNVMGTAHVLEAARRCDHVRVVVNITSDKCYENSGEQRGFRESDPLGGADPYSSSKGCAELVTNAYRRSFLSGPKSGQRQLALASARAGNVIGGGDWSAYRLVPDLMRAMMDGNVPTIRHPDATRPWQHVLEPLAGYLCLAERLWQDTAYAEPWNFGPSKDDTRPVSWVADELVRLWGGNARWQRDMQAHAAEATSLHLDCSKAKTRLGWSPRLPLAAALSWTVEWFKSYRAGSDVRRITEDHIDRYQNLKAL